MAKSKTKDDKSCSSLPPDVTKADLKHTFGSSIPYVELTALGLNSSTLTFYEVDGRKTKDWVLRTLFIGRGKEHADRYYGITLDGKVVRVGKGPHVKQEITVYITRDNMERLKRYIDLYVDGLRQAGQIRDRISSRRAQGQMERAAGHHSWMWNN